MRKYSDDPKCSENMLEILNVDIEDPECGSIMEIIKHIKDKESKVREKFNVERYLICRIDRVAKGSYEHKYCPPEWTGEGKKFDYFLLIRVKRGKDICVHIECKEGRIEAILDRLEEKKRDYQHSNDCFCFDRAIPKTAAFVRIKGGHKGIHDIEREIKKIKFDYCKVIS